MASLFERFGQHLMFGLVLIGTRQKTGRVFRMILRAPEINAPRFIGKGLHRGMRVPRQQNRPGGKSRHLVPVDAQDLENSIPPHHHRMSFPRLGQRHGARNAVFHAVGRCR